MITRTPRVTRRRLLQSAAAFGGGALLHRAVPGIFIGDLWASQAAQTAPADQLAAFRAKTAAVPITVAKLGDRTSLLSGPGGNVVVLTGPDGKITVDGFVRPAWEAFKKALDGLDSNRLSAMIDTHWHFDHADNNGNFRAAGGAVIAAENTKKRLTEPHDLLGMHFDPEPANALPSETFKETHRLAVNGEDVALTLIPPAHTDTDTFIHFAKANVLHMGDVFFNGSFPFIDASTGGTHRRHDRGCRARTEDVRREDQNRAGPWTTRGSRCADDVPRRPGDGTGPRAEGEAGGSIDGGGSGGETDRGVRREMGSGVHGASGVRGAGLRNAQVGPLTRRAVQRRASRAARG